MKKHALSISYVVLLSLCLPLAYLYLCLWSVLPIPYEAVYEWADTFWKGLFCMLVFFAPIGVYWLAVLILGIMNIVRSFRTFKAGDTVGCINGMLIHKYGLVIFFVTNFVILTGLYLIMTLAVVVGTRGFAILMAPFLLPWLIVAIGLTIFASWLAMIPGAFYGIQVIRFTLKEKKTSIGAAVWHGILQFLFLADVLDAMYLAVKKWGRGKKSSVAVAIVYIVGFAGLIWLVVWLRSL